MVFPGPGWRCDPVDCPFDLEFTQYSRTLLIKWINRWGLPLGVSGRKEASVAIPTYGILRGGPCYATTLHWPVTLPSSFFPGPVTWLEISRAAFYSVHGFPAPAGDFVVFLLGISGLSFSLLSLSHDPSRVLHRRTHACPCFSAPRGSHRGLGCV